MCFLQPQSHSKFVGTESEKAEILTRYTNNGDISSEAMSSLVEHSWLCSD